MSLAKDTNDYSETYVKKHAKFPKINMILLIVIAVAQLVTVIVTACYTPKPQDVIESYLVTVTPRADGEVDIEYDITWRALDEDEPLTWVTVGLANGNVAIYTKSLSDTIRTYSWEVEEGYTALRFDFKDAYMGGETVHFSFRVRQRDLLCQWDSGCFYEFVPGWFNRIPIERYEFRWAKSENIVSAAGATDEGDYYLWSGSLEPGGYEVMQVTYTPDAFEGANYVAYDSFDGEGAYNDLAGDKADAWMAAFLAIMIGLIFQVYMIDSYVSYRRGRGFLRGYGYHVHTYGRVNPLYVSARDVHVSSRGGGRSGGCACACACACAGGGRAGCSQKDTFDPSHKTE